MPLNCDNAVNTVIVGSSKISTSASAFIIVSAIGFIALSTNINESIKLPPLLNGYLVLDEFVFVNHLSYIFLNE